jgi:hypothetical protein
MANNDLRSAGAVWSGFLARYLFKTTIFQNLNLRPLS